MVRSVGAARAETASARRHGRRMAGLLRVIAGRATLPALPSVEDLPWLSTLDEEHLRQFLHEYAAAYQEALDGQDWAAVDDLVAEWEATAEALADPELRRLLDEPSLPAADRVPLDYPA